MEHTDFYLRYYVGHKTRDCGHEFMEMEIAPSGMENGKWKLRYANNSNYKSDTMIRKEVFISPTVVDEIIHIVEQSQIRGVDDSNWVEPDQNRRRQELEVKISNEHIAFTCVEIGSSLDVERSSDPEGMRIFYFFTMDLKGFIFSLLEMHFKVKPIP